MKIWTDVNRNRCPECQSTHIQKNGKNKGKRDRICYSTHAHIEDEDRHFCDGITRSRYEGLGDKPL